jgi:hypothetical protein
VVSDPRPSAEPSEQESTREMSASTRDTQPNTGVWSLAPAQWPDARAGGPATPPDDDPPTQPHPMIPEPSPAAAAPPTDARPVDSVPTAPYRPPVGPPSRVYVPRPVAVTAPPSQPIMMPTPPRARRRPPVWLYVLAAVVVLGVVVGLGLYGLHGGDGQDAAPSRNTTSTEATAFEAQISGFSDRGTNFRPEGNAWTTQTYRTPEFGGLKTGVGLILDLGRPERVTGVNFTAVTGPLSVDLRVADQKPAGLEGWTKVSGTGESATGATSLPVSSTEKHRYWLIWVTRLGSDKKAVIGDVRVVGTT